MLQSEGLGSPAPTEFEQRRARLIAELASRGLHAVLIASPVNVRYFSGFTGSNAMLLVAPESSLLVTDSRYDIQARLETTCQVRIVKGKLPEFVARRLGAGRKIGFEEGRVAVAAHQSLKDSLKLATTLEPLGGLLESCRMVKSRGEIDLIRRAVATTSKAFEAAIARVRPGMTESDLALEIDYRMRRLGAEKPAFDTIVASGPRAALPHARPSDQAIAANQLLLVDMGASQAGYSSDMTRTVAVGRASREARSLYGSVLEAQLAAIDRVRPGVPVGEVDRAARAVLKAHGLDKKFTHSTGHGLGLEIHEPPRIARRERIRLKPGMVITIEPGVYIEGRLGIRIEDTVLVTDRGHEVLTPTSKELMAIG